MRVCVALRDEEETVEISGGKRIEVLSICKWLLMR